MAENTLVGKVALVTGAALRVGRAIALGLADAGADIAIHYRTSSGPAEELARRIQALKRRAVPIAADLAQPDECRGLIRSVLANFGALDLLVHSASSFRRAELSETTEEIWDAAMNVNARSGLLLARAAASELARRRGRVVLISDLMASEPAESYLAHSVSKAAVEGLVRALAVELAPEVQVNGVAPGTVLVPEGTPPEEAARYARKTLLQRIGEPEDIAKTVLFLCAGPSFITGQVLRVDGGQTIR